MINKRVAIGILAFARPDDLILTISSVIELSTPNITIYVLQNGMSDGDFKRICIIYPQVIGVMNAKNLGAAGGRNRLIDIALEGHYDYLCFLDSDAQLASDALGKLLCKYPALTRPGLVSCLVYVTETPGRIHSSGVTLDRSSFRDFHHRDVPDRDIIERDAVVTTAALISCNVLRNAPRLDERIFAYWEDVDWCLQMQNCGFINYVIRDAVAFHSESRSRFHPSIIYYTTRNHLLIVRKLGVSIINPAVIKLIWSDFSDLIRRILVRAPLALNCLLAFLCAIFHSITEQWGIAPSWMRRSNEQFLETKLYEYIYQSRVYKVLKLVWRRFRGDLK